MSDQSLLHIVESCDNFNPHNSEEPLTPWFLDPTHTFVIGLLRPQALAAIRKYNEKLPIFSISESAPNALPKVAFLSELNTPAKRSAAMKTLCETWRDSGLFPDEIGGRLWRDELYTVYNHPYTNLTTENTAFVMERAACKLFGVITYGVHMTMYTLEDELKIWVPTRAATKQTWPGYLDNSVAGGIPYGMTPQESLVKECDEEASLSAEFVKAHLRQVGSISYYSRTKTGWLEPEVQFVYELLAPKGLDVTPKPSDGEVQSFELCTLENIIEKMHARKFKPNTAAVIVEFMMRHGLLTAENEPNYLEMLTRLHRRFEGYGQIAVP